MNQPPFRHSLLTAVERAILVVCLHEHNAHAQDTARALGMSRNWLSIRLRRHKLRRREYTPGPTGSARAAMEVLLSRDLLAKVEQHLLDMRSHVFSGMTTMPRTPDAHADRSRR